MIDLSLCLNLERLNLELKFRIYKRNIGINSIIHQYDIHVFAQFTWI